jgi:hypothetical protein
MAVEVETGFISLHLRCGSAIVAGKRSLTGENSGEKVRRNVPD